MKQIALIGVSGYGAAYLRHFKALEKQKKVKLAAAVIRNPDKVHDVYEELLASGTMVFPSEMALYEKFAGKLDLVGIPTAIDFHERMMNNALRAGANVMLEKPVAGSLHEVDRMIETCRKYKKQFVAVGFQHTYSVEFQMFQRRLQQGEFGKLKAITVVSVWPRNDAYYQRNNWTGKKFAEDGTPIWDSPANNAFAHFLNISLFLCAEQFGESAYGVLRSAKLQRARKTIETFDICELEIEANGVKIRNFFSHAGSETIDPIIRIKCENNTIEWSFGRQWKIFDKSGRVIESAPIVEPHQRMFDSVVERIENPDAFIYTLEAARNHTAVVEQMKAVAIQNVPPELILKREADGQLIADSVTKEITDRWQFAV